ncbi:MAG: nucleotidyltransferase family protein [Firmicutes bacterium]|jgi:GTP:adenosylcobinamide-phosphate guanylyltransferase|nr:nucleotidyltransferase family protein [Bacillota bacterium]
MRVDAVILAGADNDGALGAVSSEKYEAAIDVGGKPMLYYVLAGVLCARSVDRVTVVGPVDALRPIIHSAGWANRVSLVERRDSIVENLMAGLGNVPVGKKALVVTGDIPFITGEALDDFVARCEKKPAAVHYALVLRSTNEAKFPGVKRTYVKMADGVMTGGNVFMVDPEVVARNRDIISEAVKLRKKPFQLLRMLGLKLMLRFAFGRLTIGDVERKVEEWLGLQGRGIISPYAEIGVDVDKPSDLALARQVLAGR